MYGAEIFKNNKKFEINEIPLDIVDISEQTTTTTEKKNQEQATKKKEERVVSAQAPPAAKATKAGAPKILFVEHWVAKIETAKAPGETPSLVTK